MNAFSFIDNDQVKSKLCSLYRTFGYLPYKMSKFEEYDLYARNKDFLVSDRVITFNDTDGKLLALKPDITLSIIKNGNDESICKQKVFYDEKVYRVAKSTKHFKELTQVGLECIGMLDVYDLYEVIALAAKSLSLISDTYILEVSHLGILSELLDKACPDKSKQASALTYIEQKNAHDLEQLCIKQGASSDDIQALLLVVSTYGKRDEVLACLSSIPGINDSAAFKELKLLSSLFDAYDENSRILFDFSVVNNMSYYNGIVFRGFIDGIFDNVLTGGQYDKLMYKMKRKSKALGFALYVDLLEQLRSSSCGADVDVLLLYDQTNCVQDVIAAVDSYIQQGLYVCAQNEIPEKLRYKQVVDLRNLSSGSDAIC